MKFKLIVNDETKQIDAEPSTPLLWVLRDILQLTGTKYGCGKGLCGACTVHVDGQAIRSCQLPIKSLKDKKVLTIEALGQSFELGLHPVQQAWIEADVPQCGFCQPGQIMQAASLLATHPNPSKEQIDISMSGNLCRCGTYTRIRSAIEKAIKTTDVKNYEPKEAS